MPLFALHMTEYLSDKTAKIVCILFLSNFDLLKVTLFLVSLHMAVVGYADGRMTAIYLSLTPP
jgi:hypothetical protein